MVRNIRLGLAGLLLVTLVAMSAVTFTQWAQNGWGPNLWSAATPAATSTTAGTATSTGATTVSTTVQDEVNAVGGVLDARSAVAKAGPAVVTIIVSQSITSRRGQPLGTATAVGSGVIFDSRGYIVTNNHVVEGHTSLEVVFSDGSQAAAEIVAGDSSLDLAVIKVDGEVPAVAEFADSSALEPGQPAIAIGTALGDFRNTVTAGVVSALDRDLAEMGEPTLHDLIQTDASINEGNSGGALIDVQGRVIGVNVAVVRGNGMGNAVAEGLGFAIPSNTVKQFIDQVVGTATSS